MSSDPHPSDERRIGQRDLTTWPSRGGHWLVRVAVAGARVVSAHGVPVATAAVGLLVFAVAVWGAGEVYESIAEHDALAAFDTPVLDLAVSLRSPGLDLWVSRFSDLGGPYLLPLLATVAALTMALTWRSRTPVVLMLVAGVGSSVMTAVGKQLVGRTRPPHALEVAPYPTSASFPSGHTLNTTVIVGVVVYLVLAHLHRAATRTALVVLGVVWTLAIGLSRVFLGHHWLTDVVAGWLFGLGWLAVVVTAHRLFLTARSRSAPPQRRVSARSAG